MEKTATLTVFHFAVFLTPLGIEVGCCAVALIENPTMIEAREYKKGQRQ